jgi:hypothetical protein
VKTGLLAAGYSDTDAERIGQCFDPTRLGELFDHARIGAGRVDFSSSPETPTA